MKKSTGRFFATALIVAALLMASGCSRIEKKSDITSVPETASETTRMAPQRTTAETPSSANGTTSPGEQVTTPDESHARAISGTTILADAKAVACDEAGNIYAVRTSVPDANVDSRPETTDALIKIDAGTGRETRLCGDTVFFGISSVTFSFDGKYMAVNDISNDDSILYVVDTKTGETLNMGEEGFGTVTYSYSWSPDKDRLFAMTGGDGYSQLMYCDFTSKGERKVKAYNEEKGSVSTSLSAVKAGVAYEADGKVMLSDGQNKKELCKGAQFICSGDRAYLAIRAISSMEEDVLSENISIFDIAAGKAMPVANNITIYSYAFDSAGTLFYTTDSGESDYKYALYMIVKGSYKAILAGYLKYGDIIAGSKAGAIFMIDNAVGEQSTFEISVTNSSGQ